MYGCMVRAINIQDLFFFFFRKFKRRELFYFSFPLYFLLWLCTCSVWKNVFLIHMTEEPFSLSDSSTLTQTPTDLQRIMHVCKLQIQIRQTSSPIWFICISRHKQTFFFIPASSLWSFITLYLSNSSNAMFLLVRHLSAAFDRVNHAIHLH